MVQAGAGAAAQLVNASKEGNSKRYETDLRPIDTIKEIAGRMAQMEALIHALRNDNLTLQQQQERRCHKW